MPSLDTYLGTHPVKGLIGGRPGSGKTCLPISLLAAGYTLRVLDLESKISPLAHLAAQRGLYTQMQNQTDVITVAPTYGIDARKQQMQRDPQTPVWSIVQHLLMNWPGIGSISNMTNTDVLIIDSLSALGTAAVEAGRNELGTAHGRHIGAAQEGISLIFDMLRAESVRCHVLVNCHLQPIASGEYGSEYYPNVPGRQLSPMAAGYFDLGALVESRPGPEGPQYTFTCHPKSGYGYLKVPAAMVPIPQVLWSDVALGWLFEAILGRPGPSGLSFHQWA